MTIEACYAEIGGNYEEIKKRLPNTGLIEKLVGKFLEDKSFDSLCEEMKAGNRGDAFRAAHTLKGVCANLGFTRLLNSTSILTEELRHESDVISNDAFVFMENVREDYQITVTAIQSYKRNID